MPPITCAALIGCVIPSVGAALFLGIGEILGTDFQRMARKQVADFGARLRDEHVEEVGGESGRWSVTLESGEKLTARYLVLSEGKAPKLAKLLGLEFDANAGIAT